MALYEATDGDNWTNNANWCSDLPLTEWYGIFMDPTDGKRISSLDLRSNNLRGSIPEEISDLKGLQQLDLSWNTLEGPIPASICELQNLESLNLKQNALTGPIPDNIGNMPLNFLDLSWNRLTGTIPASVADIMNEDNAGSIKLNYNLLSGKVPAEIIEDNAFNQHWVMMLYQEEGNVLDIDDAEIKAPVFETTAIDGTVINTADVYKDNVYTVLFHWSIGCGFSMAYMPVLNSWYKEYKDSGVEVIAYSGDSVAAIESVVAANGLTWTNLRVDQFSDLFSECIYIREAPATPFVAVVDSDGYIVHNPINDNRDDIIKLFEDKWGDLGSGEEEKYVSTDFTANGTVKTLQTADEGNGINIVIMGDGYSDRQIADGTYDADIANAYAAMFSVEPYKNFKNLFNVYSVAAVSRNEGFAEGNETVFKGWLSDAGTGVGGDDQIVFEYAANAVADLSETLIIVVMNDLRYGGTCYMYFNPDFPNDWGFGRAVAYVPLSSSSSGDTFAQVLTHEAGGHGFAKLVDEYYNGNATITPEEIAAYKAEEAFGFYKNGDFTDNVDEVKWAHFLADERYAYDGLGVFEGGYAYYAFGVFRPTQNSIMNDNTGGFNAPSREAIYYRIHKLAYGTSWEYDYEEFVKYDEINRAKDAVAAQRRRRANYVEKAFVPTAPPVLVRDSRND